LKATAFTQPADVVVAYTALSSLITDWILNDAANYSNLILDPDLDSYWLMDAFVAKLPRLTEDLSSAGARSIAFLQPGRPNGSSQDPLSPDERLELSAL